MSDARVEPIYEDRVRARELLKQAETFLADVNKTELSSESQSILVHSAAVAACDAILQAKGLRVTSGDRSHILRLEAALEQFNHDTEELLERLDASRERRNDASYSAGFVPQASVVDAREAPAELIELVRTVVS